MLYSCTHMATVGVKGLIGSGNISSLFYFQLFRIIVTWYGLIKMRPLQSTARWSNDIVLDSIRSINGTGWLIFAVHVIVYAEYLIKQYLVAYRIHTK